MKRYFALFIYIALLLTALDSRGQTMLYQEEVRLKWIGIQNIPGFNNDPEPAMCFEGGFNDSKLSNAPLFRRLISLPAGLISARVEIQDICTSPLSASEADLLSTVKTDLSADPLTRITYSTARNNYRMDVSFIPLIRRNDTLFRINTFRMNVFPGEEQTETLKSAEYSQNSVLASGKWYKIRLSEPGIYKVTYDDLKAMGVAMETVTPSNIRLFGNGGQMLPESNKVQRYDDLQENAIQVITANAGSFASGDYFLFYAAGPHSVYLNGSRKFEHQLNVYSDYSYYFLNFDGLQGKRITEEPVLQENPDYTTDAYTDFIWYEKDQINLIRSGKQWLGERLSPASPEFTLPTLDFSDYYADRQSWIRIRVVGRNSTIMPFSVSLNNGVISTPFTAAYSNYDYARSAVDLKSFYLKQAENKLSVKIIAPNDAAVGWLDWIELNVPRKLIFKSGQLTFADPFTVWPGRVTKYIMEVPASPVYLWDITDPLNVKTIQTSRQGTTMQFVIKTDTLRKFIAWDNIQFLKPQFVATVPNQNLHGMEGADMLIVTPSAFLSQANRLAAHHRIFDGMTVEVATNEQIYNEFSSGSPDISAIRDFCRMLYQKEGAGKKLGYLLLFGDGSYDYKDRVPQNTNRVLTFETNESLNQVASYASDDFFGLMDTNEGYDAQGSIDIGIGRFPVTNLEQAKIAVDKCLNYTSNSEGVMGEWRNTLCFIADDEDGNLHFRQVEYDVTPVVKQYYPRGNINKIYLDSYKQLSTPTGQRYPEVNTAIGNQIERGALIMNYTGHGGEAGWAHESILSTADIKEWNNYDKLPVFVTATCSFSRFDDPLEVSAGEEVFLSNTGGGIALFTTTRLANAGNNLELTVDFYDTLFIRNNGRYPRFGDVIAYAKNQNRSPESIRNFVLLGDPAMQPAYPRYNVVTSKINSNNAITRTDTISAMSEVIIEGYISDDNNQVIGSFNGEMDVKIFDKPRQQTTMGNDPESYPAAFTVQESVIYQGKASVNNGVFSLSFIVPRDIDYSFGPGRISYYAHTETTDASGYYDGITIGGTNPEAGTDVTGPDITLFLDGENFKDGGVTTDSPLLIAYLHDQSGINMVGNGIGHDIVAIIDSNYATAAVLNAWYEADLDSYQSGKVKYRLANLDPGMHSLTLKAWDVFNNSSEKTITFEVRKNLPVTITNIKAYPNPFTDLVNIEFDQNYADRNLAVTLNIFDMKGTRVYSSGAVPFHADENHVGPVTWNGLTDGLTAIPAGFYIARVFVSNGNVSGEKAIKIIHAPVRY